MNGYHQNTPERDKGNIVFFFNFIFFMYININISNQYDDIIFQLLPLFLIITFSWYSDSIFVNNLTFISSVSSYVIMFCKYWFKQYHSVDLMFARLDSTIHNDDVDSLESNVFNAMSI